MHKRLYAQRQHIIQSLDILLYELHVLAFFLSPSIWTLIFRVLSQSQCSKPREVDAAWSLRAFFALLICLNSLTVWTHATSGASEGKTVILDFIGLASAPSKFRLLSLDFLIVFLQMVLAAIAYETSLAKDNDDSAVPPLSAPSPSPGTVPDRTKPCPPRSSPPYVLDLRFGTVMTRLRNPLPPAGSTNIVDGLPLPNTTPTTPWPLPAVGLRMLLGVPPGRPGREANEPGEGNARIPGALPDVG
ncbi:hypothetical protein C8F04DRAFT_1065387 [Mycena alexandri]|uniref:DUF1746 domain-containing protein n=1 Tax=Mycena alexandri TaxID=1745969 RepID=A0AAD6TFE2_9AGAR|nr:hypothetical protein C8F04DRAFT_1065387 [Mycena alexandri]